jgi:predicted phage baseplate assembly protein
MEFDFLPKLPKSNLDDRTFKDLVEECLLRIPRYCPEWTNHNPSDPGVTLIELFAWLTDQMLLRFNQVPRRNYVAFLELLGIRLKPPTPAQTEVTFYLTTTLGEAYTIPAGAEVATLRTETEEAIVFSTDQALVIGCPTIRHLLTEEPTDMEFGSEAATHLPQVLRDRLVGNWVQQTSGHWQGSEIALFGEMPQPGHCFYLVLDADEPLDGNVLEVNFEGEAATPTGINPDDPPRLWEAWNGEKWEPVLLHPSDDRTRGFSFHELAEEEGSPLQAGTVRLHLPLSFPAAQFITYRGRWLRCTYTPPQQERGQTGYESSPCIVGFGVQAIGGTVNASQSSRIENELIGESDGTPGQTFRLQSGSILPRHPGEHLLVTPPGGLPEIWTEVTDFSESTPTDRHYLLDSLTGTLQFGPLIREPAQLKQQTQQRAQIQSRSSSGSMLADAGLPAMERQYGAVPPRGATLRMAAYRTGGGQQGNVQRGAIRVLKTAIPYVLAGEQGGVINHQPARGGADAESLDEAVIRVPQLLRTRNRAVTPEDFEVLAMQAATGRIARALCPLDGEQIPGLVRLLLVPQANLEGIERSEGLSPDALELRPELRQQVTAYLDERKLLGVQLRLEEPEYVGVTVRTEVALEPEYLNPTAQEEILQTLRIALYRFLNPLTGGFDGRGWEFGRPVYPSDIVTLFQRVRGVRYLGVVQLFERRRRDRWEPKLPVEPVIDPGKHGLICSWSDHQLRSGHAINLIQSL